MKDHDQQASASENFAGPVDFETPRPDLPVHFSNFHKPCSTGEGTHLSNTTVIQKKTKVYFQKILLSVMYLFVKSITCLSHTGTNK